jgi:hypothetical protein
MEPVNLSILVVNCKQYIPTYNWYFCKSGRYFCGTANSPDDICFNEARLKEYNDSDDYVLMPECPGMTDEEAAVVLKWWCRQNNIPYNDDMNNIDAAYRWYYKYEEEGDNYSPIYHLATH